MKTFKICKFTTSMEWMPKSYNIYAPEGNCVYARMYCQKTRFISWSFPRFFIHAYTKAMNDNQFFVNIILCIQEICLHGIKMKSFNINFH